jgi:hypothetical protein
MTNYQMAHERNAILIAKGQYAAMEYVMAEIKILILDWE